MMWNINYDSPQKSEKYCKNKTKQNEVFIYYVYNEFKVNQ